MELLENILLSFAAMGILYVWLVPFGYCLDYLKKKGVDGNNWLVNTVWVVGLFVLAIYLFSMGELYNYYRY